MYKAKTNRELGVKSGDFVCRGFTGSQSPVLVDLACPDSCFAWGYDAYGNRRTVYEPRAIKDVVEHIIQNGMTDLARQIVKTDCWPEIAREIKRKINPYFWQSDAPSGAKVFEESGIKITVIPIRRDRRAS
jgi:hypothetical protein